MTCQPTTAAQQRRGFAVGKCALDGRRNTNQTDGYDFGAKQRKRLLPNSGDTALSLTSIAARRFQAGPIGILVSAIDSLLQLCDGRDHFVHVRDWAEQHAGQG
jgi:hypothetical protein